MSYYAWGAGGGLKDWSVYNSCFSLIRVNPALQRIDPCFCSLCIINFTAYSGKVKILFFIEL